MHKNGSSTRRRKISSSGRGQRRRGKRGRRRGKREKKRKQSPEKPKSPEEDRRTGKRVVGALARVSEGWRGRFSLSARYNK